MQAGTNLERAGIALLRRPENKFRNIDTLLDALKLGKGLQTLMQRDIGSYGGKGLDEYPAISPMLALRKSTKSVLETIALEGDFRGFSEDGQRLVTYSNSDSQSRLYDLSGNELAAFEGDFISFSDDGQRLVTYSDSDSQSRLYDLSGHEPAAFEVDFSGFSDDGQQFVVYSPKEQISRFYNLSGQPTGLDLKGSFSEFSPNQQYIVTTVFSEDISQIYDTAGKLLAEYPGSVFSGRGSDLGFTPDSTQLITQSNDGLYHIWQLDDGLEDLLASGCEWVKPYLKANQKTETRAAFCLTDY